MCGIVGYIGKRQAAPILLEGLEKLEYRGYDSAGIAVRDGDREPVVVKAKGRLRVLENGTVTVGGQNYRCTKLPQKMQEILDRGGLIAALNREEA